MIAITVITIDVIIRPLWFSDLSIDNNVADTIDNATVSIIKIYQLSTKNCVTFTERSTADVKILPKLGTITKIKPRVSNIAITPARAIKTIDKKDNITLIESISAIIDRAKNILPSRTAKAVIVILTGGLG